MEKRSKKRSLPFLTAFAKSKQLYALDMNTDDFIEMAYDVWRTIGNIAPEIHRFFTKVPDDFVIEIPKNCEFIQSVTSVDRQSIVTTFDSGGKKDRHVPAHQVASNLPGKDDSIQASPGSSVNYVLLDSDSIKITSAELLNADIMIVYKSILSDEDGLPLLNDKEVAGIAAEVAKRDLIRKGFQGVGAANKMQSTMLQFIIGEADRLLAAAKIDEIINDDAIDRLLDISTSWDRKVYGRRFKHY